MKVLIVDDSPEMQLTLKQILLGLGVQSACAANAAEARAALSQESPALILLDVSLPDGDGFTFCSELQRAEKTRAIPVVFITGRAEVTNKIAAFSLGAEDYIVKPFDPLEVQARLGAKFRKFSQNEQSRSQIHCGPFFIDLDKQRVFLGEERRALSLTPKEFLLLAHLARAKEKVCSRAQLLDAVWGQGADVFDRTVDAHISALRRKLGAHAVCLESVPGLGYRFSFAQLQPKAS